MLKYYTTKHWLLILVNNDKEMIEHFNNISAIFKKESLVINDSVSIFKTKFSNFG